MPRYKNDFFKNIKLKIPILIEYFLFVQEFINIVWAVKIMPCTFYCDILGVSSHAWDKKLPL